MLLHSQNDNLKESKNFVFGVDKESNIGWIVAQNEILFFDCNDVENNVYIFNTLFEYNKKKKFVLELPRNFSVDNTL